MTAAFRHRAGTPGALRLALATCLVVWLTACGGGDSPAQADGQANFAGTDPVPLEAPDASEADVSHAPNSNGPWDDEVVPPADRT